MPEPVSLVSLWLAILVASVVVFVASSIVWMVLGHHKHDWGKLPGEDALMEAMRSAGVQPGQYAFPNCEGDMKKMAEPEFVEKMKAGPMGMMIVGPSGPPQMGKSLRQWFIHTIVVGIFVAYIASSALPAGAAFGSVLRIAGTAAMVAYAMAIIPSAIWFNRTWNTVFKEVADGVAYGLLTGLVFALLWPGAAGA